MPLSEPIGKPFFLIFFFGDSSPSEGVVEEEEEEGKKTEYDVFFVLFLTNSTVKLAMRKSEK